MTNTSRRKFIKRSSQVCLGCCAMAMGSRLNAMSAFLNEDEIPDPKKLNYCAYTCPEDCAFYVATIENDPVKKKEAYDKWDIKGRYNIEFDPETAICYRCKTEDKPEGVVTGSCTVRSCAREKGIDCCIECQELKACEKALWKKFPDFHKGVIQLQEKYMASQVS